MSLSLDSNEPFEFQRGYLDYDRQYREDGVSCPYVDSGQRAEWERGIAKAYEDHITNA